MNKVERRVGIVTKIIAIKKNIRKNIKIKVIIVIALRNSSNNSKTIFSNLKIIIKIIKIKIRNDSNNSKTIFSNSKIFIICGTTRKINATNRGK